MGEHTALDDDAIAAIRRDMLKFAQLQLRDASAAEARVSAGSAAPGRGGAAPPGAGLPLFAEAGAVMDAAPGDLAGLEGVEIEFPRRDNVRRR